MGSGEAFIDAKNFDWFWKVERLLFEIRDAIVAVDGEGQIVGADDIVGLWVNRELQG